MTIKKVKYQGRPISLLGGRNREHSLEGEGALNKRGREMVNGIIRWLRNDYKENGDKIGAITAQYYFEPYQIDLGEKIDGGGMRFNGTNLGDLVYELVLEIRVPLKGLGFSATDVHTYRWNTKYNEFQHESTEIV